MQPVMMGARRAMSSVSVGQASTSFLRSFGPLGNSLNAAPNTVPASQEFFAHKTAHTYWARSADKFSVGGVWVLTGLTSLLSVAGMVDLIVGSNKKA